jgi:hypothetical protein
MIQIKNIKILKKYSIRIHKKPEPRSHNPALPSLFFNGIFIGMTGSGKSYSLITMLKIYEREGIYDEDDMKCEIRYILVSPTSKSDANAVFQLLKIEEDDLIDDFSFEALENKVNELIQEKQSITDWNLYIKAIKKMRKHDDIESLTEEELELLDKYGMDDDGKDLRRKATKIYFMIFDDMISTPLFSRSSKNKMNNLIILCRHHSICCLMTAQHLKAIPPLIRSNSKVYVIFKSNNYKKVLDDLYTEVSGLITPEDFEKMYLTATEESHNHLTIIIDNKMENKYKYRKGWNDYFILDK